MEALEVGSSDDRGEIERKNDSDSITASSAGIAITFISVTFVCDLQIILVIMIHRWVFKTV